MGPTPVAIAALQYESLMLVDALDGSSSALATVGYTVAGAAAAGAAIAGLRAFAWALGGQYEKWPAAQEGESEMLLAKRGCHNGSCHAPAVNLGTEPMTGGLLVSTFLMALPSVIGSCCWPLLLVTAFGAGSSVGSPGARVFSHHFTFGADIVFFGWLIWHLASSTQMVRPAGPCWIKWGPLIAVVVGSLLILLDPMRHVLLDHGGVFFEERTLAMYADGGGLSAVGKLSQACTITGLSLLFLGTFWFFSLPARIFSRLCTERDRLVPDA